MTDLAEVAEVMARVLHEDDTYGNESYANGHLAKVASLARTIGLSDEAIAAAWLHDSVEDHPYDISFDHILDRFGPIVRDYVRALTHIPGQENSVYLQQVARGGAEVVAVKICDSRINMAKTIASITASLRSRSPLGADDVRRFNKYVDNLKFLIPEITDPELRAQCTAKDEQ